MQLISMDTSFSQKSFEFYLLLQVQGPSIVHAGSLNAKKHLLLKISHLITSFSRLFNILRTRFYFSLLSNCLKNHVSAHSSQCIYNILCVDQFAKRNIVLGGHLFPFISVLCDVFVLHVGCQTAALHTRNDSVFFFFFLTVAHGFSASWQPALKSTTLTHHTGRLLQSNHILDHDIM